MTTETNHSPTPWRKNNPRDHAGGILDANGQYAATVDVLSHEQPERIVARRDLILTAVNSHAANVARIAELEKELAAVKADRDKWEKIADEAINDGHWKNKCLAAEAQRDALRQAAERCQAVMLEAGWKSLGPLYEDRERNVALVTLTAALDAAKGE